jgi:hypothetical protein
VSLITSRPRGSPRPFGLSSRHGDRRLRQQLTEHHPSASVERQLELDVDAVLIPIVTLSPQHEAVRVWANVIHGDFGHGNLRLGLEIRPTGAASRTFIQFTTLRS